jgi:hypothetical protein
VAAYVNAGILYYVTLDDGKVIGRVVTPIPRDQQCLGATAEGRKYFLCQDRTGSALYRFDGKSSIVASGYWEQQRSFGAVTDAGVIVQGPCAKTGLLEGAFRRYCGVFGPGKSFEFQVPNNKTQTLPLLLSEGQAVAFELPTPNHPGALHWFGARVGSTEVKWPKRGRGQGLVEDGFFLRELTLQQGQLSGYLARGDGIQGYRITLDGQLRLGPLVTFCPRARQ